MASALESPNVVTARAFSPGHITGYFEPSIEKSPNLLHVGSIGAGFSIDHGISTTVAAYESNSRGFEISINGRTHSHADVSKQVVEKYLRMYSKNIYLSIWHEVSIPIGYGLGSSGAAALSLSIALNKALNTGLTDIQVAQVAHIAEIECGTGLGTVISEFHGGFEVRSSPGGPGVGLIKSTPLEDYRAVILCISPISTKKWLDAIQMKNIRSSGLVSAQINHLDSPEVFLEASQKLAVSMGLTSGRCRAPMLALSAEGFKPSVALFGETVFTLVKREAVKKAAEILKPFAGTLLICKIDSLGARSL